MLHLNYCWCHDVGSTWLWTSRMRVMCCTTTRWKRMTTIPSEVLQRIAYTYQCFSHIDQVSSHLLNLFRYVFKIEKYLVFSILFGDGWIRIQIRTHHHLLLSLGNLLYSSAGLICFGASRASQCSRCYVPLRGLL